LTRFIRIGSADHRAITQMCQHLGARDPIEHRDTTIVERVKLTGIMGSSMITRRILLGAVAVAAAATAAPVRAQGERPFSAQAFAAAQQAGQPILIEIHADWCPTCKAQKPILSELTSQPKFSRMVVLRVDFDRQKDVVKQFGAQLQSTLIVYKGDTEVARSVGETKRDAIAALLNRAI
jgi:thiol:disulfide interchange protein